MNKEGAIAGMISGFLFTAGYIIYFKFINPAADNADGWMFGISPEGIGTLGTLINLVVAVSVGRLFADPPEDVQQIVETIRLPGEAMTHQ